MVAFDWNDLPMGREFDCKFLKKVKSPPYALPLIFNFIQFYIILKIILQKSTRVKQMAHNSVDSLRDLAYRIE